MDRNRDREHRERVTQWFAERRTAYPWRRDPTPYRVLVSEAMLQQTQASRVAPAFVAFLARFPTLEALASSPKGEVVASWSGLGYNKRAVALWEAAGKIVREHGGQVPADPAVLLRLAGVGPYTAAAVASLAYGAPVPAIDTNAERVVSRYRLGVEPGGARRAEIRGAAEAWLDRSDPGGWNQAMMDLGRLVCRPVPRCGSCPLVGGCRFRLRRDSHRGPLSQLGGSLETGSPHPRPARRRAAFDGSVRQVRGSIVRMLKERRSLTVGALSRGSRVPVARISEAVAALASEGVIRAGPAALAGRERGRAWLER